MALISILTPAYNEGRYIDDAIESVLKYNGIHEIEHIIVDDGSSDDTYEKAIAFAERHPNIVRVFRNPSKGKVSAINHAFEKCRGEAIVAFAGDDLLRAENVDDRVGPVLAESGPALSRAALESFFDVPENRGKRTPLQGGGNKSGGASAMNRRFAEIYFPVPVSLPNEDTWMDAVAVGFGVAIYNVDAVALDFRIHSGNSWNRNSNFKQYDLALRIRNDAYSLAVAQFSSNPGFDVARVSPFCWAENLRRDRKVFSLLMLKEMSLRDRRHFIFSAHPLLFEAKRLVGNFRFGSIPKIGRFK